MASGFHRLLSRTILSAASSYSRRRNTPATATARATAAFSPFLRVGRAESTTTQPLSEKQEVSITFVRANGDRIKAKGKIGDTILDIVVNNEIDLDGYGACEGTLTCSTCHLIFPKEVYEALPDKPTDEELDMLDLAYDLTDTYVRR